MPPPHITRRFSPAPLTRRSALRGPFTALLALCVFAGTANPAHAQISLSTAIDLALRDSPKVQLTRADLDKAHAALTEARDAYVPQIITTGGYGRSTGAPLGVPVIFSISGQSLVFTFSQSDFIRSARAALSASEHALAEAQIEVAEDTTNTYLALDNELKRRDVLRSERDLSARLVAVTGDRVSAGIDARVESTKARRTAAQIRLQALLLDDTLAADTRHLAGLTGLPATHLLTDRASIPMLARPLEAAPGNDTAADSEGVIAAFAIARSRELQAFGDRRYLLRPQVLLQANYSRVDAGLSSYLAYYPRYNGTAANPNSANSLGFGLSITIPLLDMAHRAKALQSAADAAHARAEAYLQRDLFQEGRAKLRNAALELDARAELARLDQELAQNQLEALQLQLQPVAANLAGPQATPKDELNAELGERQKFYDVLSAELQLQQVQINLLRQQGGLGDWIHQSLATSPAAATPTLSLPTANSSAPISTTPSSALPSTPTVGSPTPTPSTLPGSPAVRSPSGAPTTGTPPLP